MNSLVKFSIEIKRIMDGIAESDLKECLGGCN